LTDNPDILNAPTNFRIHIREVDLSAGAGFIIPLTGDVMTMPGLGKVPGAVKMQDEPW
jgi:formate--tetrahydrofolate ligase